MISLGKLLRSPITAGLLVATLVFFIILSFRITGNLESLELAAYDWVVRMQPAPLKSDPRIVLISITENDIQKQGQWPLSDELLAQALEILVQYKPRAIGVDIYRDVPVPPPGEINLMPF